MTVHMLAFFVSINANLGLPQDNSQLGFGKRTLIAFAHREFPEMR